jgi:O-antigen/teichoic acid export membrane protein
MVKKYGVSFNTKYIRYAFAFCIPLVPYYLSNHLLNQVDRVMITDLLGFESNAIYSVAYTASTVSIILWSSISGVLIPYLYRNLKSDDEKSVKKIVTMVVAIFSIITILISLLSPEIMFILGPKSYSIGRMYIPIIVNGIFFSILGTIVSTLILYFKSSINMVLITIISASLNILLNTLLIPYVGVIGAALSTFISYFFMASLYMLYFYFKFNKHFLPSINIIALSLFTILLSFSSYFFMENLFIRLILIILLTFSIIFVTKQTLKKILIKQEVNHS